MSDKTISIVTIDDEKSNGITSKGSDSSSIVYRNLPVDKIKDNVNDFTNNISAILDGIDGKINNYQLDEIELNVEMTASGSIRLIGSVEVGTKGAIKLSFKRHNHE